MGLLVGAFNRVSASLALSHGELQEKLAERTRELQLAATELRLLSNKDALSGCYNRRYMDERLELEIQRSWRYDGSFSLVL